MNHTYTLETTAHVWKVGISPSTNYGYFYYDGEKDLDIEGGLWFQGKTLVDYDGVFELPKKVIDTVVSFGFAVDKDFYPGVNR